MDSRSSRRARRAPVQAEQLYTPDEACNLLGLGKTRLYELMDSGAIAPTYKLSHKARRIPESAIKRYLESRII